MRIDVTRERYTTNGWEPLPTLTLHEFPAEAEDLARHRLDGPTAPTDDEIETACQRKYRRSDGPGTLNIGDVTVTRVVTARDSF